MQEVRGSNPLSSTPAQRPNPASAGADSLASRSRYAATASAQPMWSSKAAVTRATITGGCLPVARPSGCHRRGRRGRWRGHQLIDDSGGMAASSSQVAKACRRSSERGRLHSPQQWPRRPHRRLPVDGGVRAQRRMPSLRPADLQLASGSPRWVSGCATAGELVASAPVAYGRTQASTRSRARRALVLRAGSWCR
jgi:hypothetical protein